MVVGYVTERFARYGTRTQPITFYDYDRYPLRSDAEGNGVGEGHLPAAANEKGVSLIPALTYLSLPIRITDTYIYLSVYTDILWSSKKRESSTTL